MGTRLSAAAPAVILLSGMLCAAAISADTHKLARSSELGVEIDAMGGEGWCRQRLALTVHAQDAGVYPTADFTDLIKKLGQVLETECPEARHADISGLNASNELAYEGSVSASNGWVLSQSSGTHEASSGTSWGDTILGWLNILLGWASALRP